VTEDRRTKAQILAALNDTTKRLNELENQKSVNIEAPRLVPEAETLAKCIRAFDVLSTSRSGVSTSYGLYERRGPSATDVGRVLRLLADKYGVDLVESVTAPCDRPHLDDASESALVGALRNVARF
jgi:hypothetical protein